MEANYFIIPIAAWLIALVGSIITGSGMGWYATITTPSWTPSGTVIGAMWTGIYILGALSLILIWSVKPRTRRIRATILLFIANALLNVLWSIIFFALHQIGAAVFEAGLLFISVIGLVWLARSIKPLAAALLIPYALWTGFATYLTFVIWTLNR